MNVSLRFEPNLMREGTKTKHSEVSLQLEPNLMREGTKTKHSEKSESTKLKSRQSEIDGRYIQN